MTKALRLSFLPLWFLMVVAPFQRLEARTIAKAIGQEPSPLRGTVLDAQTGSPLKNAIVWLQGSNQTTVTDDGGNFRLDGISAGKHVLCLSAVNFTIVRREIEIVPGP
jgi:hypothetical protein